MCSRSFKRESDKARHKCTVECVCMCVCVCVPEREKKSDRTTTCTHESAFVCIGKKDCFLGSIVVYADVFHESNIILIYPVGLVNS